MNECPGFLLCVLARVAVSGIAMCPRMNSIAFVGRSCPTLITRFEWERARRGTGVDLVGCH